MSNGTKRIVCLANSRRQGGRCIAGKEMLLNGQTGRWIRPVSNRTDEAVSKGECQYEDGSEPRVLDVIEVPVLNAQPMNHQRENWLLDPSSRWEKIGNLTPSSLEKWVDRVEALWENGHSSYNSINNRVPEEIARSVGTSLYLIRVPKLELYTVLDYNKNPRLQARFSYRCIDYSLRVTDPAYEEKYSNRLSGLYTIGQSYLTISLSGLFQSRPDLPKYAYKLIAAIIESS